MFQVTDLLWDVFSKLIIKNLKLLVDALECEIYSDIDLYKHIDDNRLGVSDDDDGYPD